MPPGRPRALNPVRPYRPGRYKRKDPADYKPRGGKPGQGKIVDTRAWPDKIDKAKIDAEPVRVRHHCHVGTKCWFVVDGVWFLCEVVTPTRRRRVAIKPVTGRDADRQVEWPFGDVLEFAANGDRSDPGTSLRLYDRLRPLSARRP